MSKHSPFKSMRAISDPQLGFILQDHAVALRRLLRLYRWRWVAYGWAVAVTTFIALMVWTVHVGR